ncbi:hypothetical protein DB88DRAFT_481460 [Papiliotrema laurentii]|uniref:Uncharacterized protein n=1 Tax=Papiliotrema laurentii TaxID=5418 RepID=A0AAD9FUA5_PAPLA|nr:hypothetical protein DB88DRAFT_481460 [Papiliotrema laurentii]
MEENPLHRAHAISAHASMLVKSPSASGETLREALEAYQLAAQLFETASKEQKGEDERKTLSLLVNQHKKLIRDVERRIATLGRLAIATNVNDEAGPPVALRAGGNDTEDAGARNPNGALGAGVRRLTGEGSNTSPKREPVGLATAASIGTWPAGISTRLGVPPFALRHTSLNHQPPSLPRSTTSPASLPQTAGQHAQNHQPVPEPPSLSPLHSSSSSDESFLNLGVVPDTLDPFSRFWGMLENMLDDISNPVAFASAPLGINTIPGPALRSSKPDDAGKRGERKDKGKGPQRTASPSDSFFVVPSMYGRRKASPTPEDKGQTVDKDRPQDKGTVTGKTPEELALENEHLRTSLDEIASHAERLERANRALQAQHDERERTMRTIAVGMRREAQKVKQGQDLLRSQLVSSIAHPPRSARMGHSPAEVNTGAGGSDGDPALRARIKELEEQVSVLKADNEKQKGQVDKYRDKLHQIKANARAKREARAGGDKEGSAKASSSGRRGSDA